MHYINQTSAGQSGGAVLGTYVTKNGRESKFLVGVHVAGFLNSNKGTVIVESNYKWVKAQLDTQTNDVEMTKSLSERVSNLMQKLQEPHANGFFHIGEVESLPILTHFLCSHPLM